MRWLVIVSALALVATSTRLARAGDEPPTQWTLHVGTVEILPPRADAIPFVGLQLGFEHRADDRIWGGVAASLIGSSLPDETDTPEAALAVSAAVTGRVELGRLELTSNYRLEADAEGEFGLAYARYQRRRSLPVIASARLGGRFEGRRNACSLTIGWAFAFAGAREDFEPRGFDARVAYVRSW